VNLSQSEFLDWTLEMSKSMPLLSNTYDVASKWDWSAKIGQQRG